MKYIVEIDGKSYEVEVEEKESSYVVTVDGVPHEAHIAKSENLPESKNRVTHSAPVVSPTIVTPPATPVPDVQPAGSVTAPMPGTILKIHIMVGKKVSMGDVLLTLEAMKMENQITAPVSGVIKEIHAKEGQIVNSGDLLTVIS
jgi:biotin carboxyl carrier protein